MDKKSRKRDRAVKDLSPRNTQDVKGGKECTTGFDNRRAAKALFRATTRSA